MSTGTTRTPFSHAGRDLVVHIIPTIGDPRVEVWEGGRKVNTGEITATQGELNVDRGEIAQWVIERVRDGRISLMP